MLFGFQWSFYSIIQHLQIFLSIKLFFYKKTRYWILHLVLVYLWTQSMWLIWTKSGSNAVRHIHCIYWSFLYLQMFHWNDMVMIYDGSEFKAILNGHKKVVRLIGNLSSINKPRINISKPELHSAPIPPKKLFEIKHVYRYFFKLWE